MSLKKLLFSFDGRIGRRPYWWYMAAMITLLCVVFALVGLMLFSGMAVGPSSSPFQGTGYVSMIITAAVLSLVWPSLAVSAKRWHDVNKSAWWILIGLVPVVGGLTALALNGFVAGTPRANRFGPPPGTGIESV